MNVVLDDLQAGRPQLTKADNPADFVLGVEPENGWNAFGDASDLIGSQCPVQLAADTWTLASPSQLSPPATHT
jgi:hypothetical protein